MVTSHRTADQMILEVSLSLLLNSEDMGFYIGPYVLDADNADGMNSRTLIFKLWFVMAQLTVFTPYKKK